MEFSLNVRMLLALAFVPVDQVIETYDELISAEYYDDHEEELAELLNYSERTWIGVQSRSKRRRTKGLFDIALWSCYEAVLNDAIRSNNAVEGWHNAFNGRVRVQHAVIGKIIKNLKMEQNSTEVIVTQIETGLDINNKRRKAYNDIDLRLKNIVSQYDANNRLQYLKNIASILSI
ncbi:uncharacterized protein LOC130674167 [Microplitis mediator]|uniref:uncharacterized protein LOC130674167 n=1 Tax=Microplitis mediator TaxID=375433 RepID=UPI00255553B0|nr:uncharacterized protein LOC130674167 [Microplitis mediator]